MTDEEFVRANWERVVSGPYHGLDTHYFVALDWVLFVNFNPNLREAWASAAEFTRERLEQIRQLKREIMSIDWILADLQINLNVRMASSAGDDQRPLLAAVERVATMSRILARLEAALADLQQGMRTAAPDGPRRLGNG